MKNNAGVSTVYGLNGTQYNADAEGIFIVTAADVGAVAGGRLDQAGG